MDSEKAMQDALTALATLEESMKKTSTDNENVLATVQSLKADVRKLKTEDNKYIEGAKGLVQVAQGVVNNMDKFTSGDALEIASGAISLIGTIGGIVGGPVGPLIAGICGLIASILPLFGGKKGPSVAEVVEKVIREALEDFKDQDIYEHVVSSLKEMTAQIAHLNGIANQNGGILSNEEKSFLTTLDFSRVGSDTLGILQGQLDRNKNSDDNKKCGRLAMYCYYYSMISIQKTVILTLQCSLLRRNNMEGIYAGVANYLYNALPKEDQKVLGFISDLPEGRGSWWMLYRCLHTDLTAQQRMVLEEYREQIKCQPMMGQLCSIYNAYQKEYLYLPTNDLAYDSDRREVFTWRIKNEMDAQGLFRIIGSYQSCQIFGVYFGEYLYAADYAPYDNDRRRVFSWRPGNSVSQGFWEIHDGTIRNLKQNEYMYAGDYAPYDGQRRRIFTWRPGNPVKQGDWRIVPVSFERDDLTKPIMKNIMSADM